MEQPSDINSLLRRDPRYKIDAYFFVSEALKYAHDELHMAAARGPDQKERHLTGQQLCEAIRCFALEQYGYLAKVVLNSWGIHTTGDFGAIVYNLISIGVMRKSKTDKREDFNDQYDFDEVFQRDYQIQLRE